MKSTIALPAQSATARKPEVGNGAWGAAASRSLAGWSPRSIWQLPKCTSFSVPASRRAAPMVAPSIVSPPTSTPSGDPCVET